MRYLYDALYCEPFHDDPDQRNIVRHAQVVGSHYAEALAAAKSQLPEGGYMISFSAHDPNLD